MRDPLDTLRGLGSAPPATERWPAPKTQDPDARWSSPGPSWGPGSRSLGARLRGILDGKTRDWLPLCALGIVAMIGLIATTPEARAERVPTAQSQKSAPRTNVHHHPPIGRDKR